MSPIKITKSGKKRILFFMALVGAFCIMLWMVAKPYFGVSYKYRRGDISSEDIISPRDITYVNVEETEKRREEAKKRVAYIFDFQLSINDGVIESLDSFLAVLERTKGSEFSSEESKNVFDELGVRNIDDSFLENLIREYDADVFNEPIRDLLKTALSTGVSAYSREELKAYDRNGIVLKKIKETEIIQETIEIDQIIANDEIGLWVDEALLTNYSEIDSGERKLMSEVVLLFTQPNIFLNIEESNKLMSEEVQKVKPVMNTIKKGAIVIRRGEEITEENYPKLEAITLYTNTFNFKAIVGIGILLLILFYLTMIPFMEEGNRIDFKNYLILIVFTVLTVGYCYLITFIKSKPHNLILGVLVPTAGITMTAEVLFKRKFSFTLAMTLPIYLLLISGNNPYTFLFALGSGLIAIYAVKDAEKRSDMLKSNILIITVNVLILSAIGLLREMSTKDFFTLLIWGAGNGVVSVILSLGIIPFLEILWNMPTNFRLLELADLNTTVMKKIQLEAPGTYHHSINVANMAENAARYIKANPLLVRVASLYHDIGKIPNAEYYIENNQGESKHNYIKPSLSNSILKAHVKIGVETARQMKLPKAVVDIIAQHHGTSLMKYFYHQALKKEGEGLEVDKKDYHYQGPKPQSREAAIVMLADTVEAASRSMKNPSAKRIEELVNDVVESKFREGQLNESPLTLRGLMKISIVFRRYLTGLYHTRIEYPDEKEIKKQEEAL
jgi:putative nucleotidyltransferase with HDIG domain